MIRLLVTAFAGLLGLAFGSFLNLCATRWPEEENICKPRSHCRTCNRTLSWWENIPLLSWIALRGRCRTCHATIGWRYPIVELSVCLLWAFRTWTIFDIAPELNAGIISAIGWTALADCLAAMIFLWILVALAVLDTENLWLPDRLTLPGIALGFLLAITRATLAVYVLGNSTFSFWVHTVPADVVLYWFFGAVLGGTLLLVIRWIHLMIRGQEGLGFGDVKLMALLGGWLGIKLALLSFVLAIFIALAIAILWSSKPPVKDKNVKWHLRKLPFGTFLCIGGIISAFWGQAIINLYLKISGL